VLYKLSLLSAPELSNRSCVSADLESRLKCFQSYARAVGGLLGCSALAKHLEPELGHVL
jgi:hypothetical protein